MGRAMEARSTATMSSTWMRLKTWPGLSIRWPGPSAGCRRPNGLGRRCRPGERDDRHACDASANQPPSAATPASPARRWGSARWSRRPNRRRDRHRRRWWRDSRPRPGRAGRDIGAVQSSSTGRRSRPAARSSADACCRRGPRRDRRAARSRSNSQARRCRAAAAPARRASVRQVPAIRQPSAPSGRASASRCSRGRSRTVEGILDLGSGISIRLANPWRRIEFGATLRTARRQFKPMRLTAFSIAMLLAAAPALADSSRSRPRRAGHDGPGVGDRVLAGRRARPRSTRHSNMTTA